jgi:hypothetical protein
VADRSRHRPRGDRGRGRRAAVKQARDRTGGGRW